MSWTRSGTGVARRLTAEERFNAGVVKQPDGCWLWRGVRDKGGYVRFHADGSRVFVHRWAYERFVGPIPAGLSIDHLCRVRHCVNPKHLEPVTHLENMRRGTHATKTHCKNGHLLEVVPDSGSARRACRVCKRAAARASYRRRRAEVLTYQKNYYREHRAERLEYAKQYRANRPEASDGGAGCPGTKGT